MYSKMIRTLFFSAAAFCFGLTAFGQEAVTETVRWKPIEAGGKKITVTSAYIEFVSGARTFTGNTGCNHMSGTLSMGERSITIRPTVMTRRACKLMEGSIAEAAFTRTLSDAVSYSQKGSFLVLYNRRGKSVLKFQASAIDPPGGSAAGLADKKWFLNSIGANGNPIEADDVFVVFDPAKGSAGGNSGCNVFGGSYSTKYLTLSITDIVSTMRACEEGDKMQVERDLHEGLRNANRYQITGSEMTLYRDSELLLTFRGEAK